mgnify:FL=1
MAGSSMALDKNVKDFLSKIEFEKVIDIGCGSGKYGRMVKELRPDCKLVGIEKDESYIEEFSLNNVYDSIYDFDAHKLIRNADFKTDICIMGDVIEHMPKSQGIDFINYMIYRCKWLIIKYPIRFIQGAVGGHASESHISTWSKHDFEGFDIEEWAEDVPIVLVILKGYL